MSRLRIRNVTKCFARGSPVVDNVSVDIADGELVVFVGPSGCGKSTLLRMVAGLESITEGEIELSGSAISGLDPASRDIAMVFQNYALYPHMTVRRNLGYGLRNRGMAKPVIAERVEAAARLLEIDDFLDRKPAQLSGGQRQRVAMGRAIVREPALFLFDEPLSNLDAKLRNDMRPKLKALQRRIGTAMIYVTHDQLEAMTLADRIVVLNGGRVEQIGTPSEVYLKPTSAFVASFIGTPPMNVLPAEVTDRVLSVDGFTVADNVAHRGPVLLGLRPEALRVASPGTGLSVPVEAIEELGATRLLHVSFGARTLVISQGADEPVPGSRANLMLRRDQMHLFEPAGGRRLPTSIFSDAR